MAITYDFTQSDGPLVGSWATQTGENACETVSNVLRGVDIFGEHGSRRSDSWDATHSSQALSKNGSGAFREVSVRVRCQSGARSYYAGGMENFNLGSQKYRIWKVVAGTYTNLIEHATMDFATGKTIKLTVSGTTLTLFEDAVQILTITDSDLSGGTPGIGVYVGTENDAWDDWEGTGESAGGGGGTGTLVSGRLLGGILLNGSLKG